MVKASELRIGNYLKGDAISVPKLGIQSDGYTEILAFGIHVIAELETQGKPSGYEPIELTEEWLRRFGFDLIPVDQTPFNQLKMPYWCNDGFLLFFNEGEHNKGHYMIGAGEHRFGVYSVVTRRWITEVHTLQNAFYSWAGRELELTK